MIKTAEKNTGGLSENTVDAKNAKLNSALINIKLFVKLCP